MSGHLDDPVPLGERGAAEAAAASAAAVATGVASPPIGEASSAGRNWTRAETALKIISRQKKKRSFSNLFKMGEARRVSSEEMLPETSQNSETHQEVKMTFLGHSFKIKPVSPDAPVTAWRESSSSSDDDAYDKLEDPFTEAYLEKLYNDPLVKDKNFPPFSETELSLMRYIVTHSSKRLECALLNYLLIPLYSFEAASNAYIDNIDEVKDMYLELIALFAVTRAKREKHVKKIKKYANRIRNGMRERLDIRLKELDEIIPLARTKGYAEVIARLMKAAKIFFQGQYTALYAAVNK